jgi:hypothetical protein
VFNATRRLKAQPRVIEPITGSRRCELTRPHSTMGRMDPALYAIRINGHLGAMLISAFPAMVPEQEGRVTVLTGVLDQSALHGVLAEIEALGLDLLEVRLLPPGPSSSETGDARSP